MLEDSGRDELAEKADNIRSAVKEAWRSNKEKELNGTDTLMVRYFAMSVAYARRKFNIRNPFVANAINRLAVTTRTSSVTRRCASTSRRRWTRRIPRSRLT